VGAGCAGWACTTALAAGRRRLPGACTAARPQHELGVHQVAARPCHYCRRTYINSIFLPPVHATITAAITATATRSLGARRGAQHTPRGRRRRRRCHAATTTAATTSTHHVVAVAAAAVAADADAAITTIITTTATRSLGTRRGGAAGWHVHTEHSSNNAHTTTRSSKSHHHRRQRHTSRGRRCPADATAAAAITATATRCLRK
jgi:hypothetical protein